MDGVILCDKPAGKTSHDIVAAGRGGGAERRREGDRVELEIQCSSGTYVRTLIADLGDAYCAALRRTAIGPFRVEDADGETLIPLDAALGFLPEIPLAGERARAAAHGRAVPGRAEGVVRLTDANGLIALAE